MTRNSPTLLSNEELVWQQKLAELALCQFRGRVFEIAADWLRAEVEARLNGGHLTAEEDAEWLSDWEDARAEALQ